MEDDHGESLGAATPLDPLANVHRRRRKPRPTDPDPLRPPTTLNGVELAYRHYHDRDSTDEETR